MNFRKYIKQFLPEFIINLRYKLLVQSGQVIDKFYYRDNSKIKSEIESKYKFNGDLLDFFVENEGGVVHKWHHYIPVYDK